MDKGMKKVVNLVTNYMSALCETGRRCGGGHRKPGGLRTGIKRIFPMTLKNAVTKGVKAWRDRRVGYWLCIDPKTGEYYLLTSANLAEDLDGFFDRIEAKNKVELRKAIKKRLSL